MSGDCFFVVTPMRCTSGGSDGNGDGHAILHQHLRRIEIGAELESDVQRHVAVARALRRHVEHVLDAVDLLLDRRGDGFRDDLRVCAGIIRRDLDRGRRDLGILRDRKRRERDNADERDDDADHAGENRPVDEEVRKVHPRSPRDRLAASRLFGWRWRRVACTARLAPASASPAFPAGLFAGASRPPSRRPSARSSRCVCLRTSFRFRDCGARCVLSGFTTKAYFTPCCELITLSSMSAARYGVAPAMRTRTKKPGVIRAGFQFFSTARARTVPVPGSSRFSTKSM